MTLRFVRVPAGAATAAHKKARGPWKRLRNVENSELCVGHLPPSTFTMSQNATPEKVQIRAGITNTPTIYIDRKKSHMPPCLDPQARD